MKKALKNFGLGLVYFFLLPVFFVIAALAGVYALFVIFYYVAKGLVRFFKGDKFFKPLAEDLKVQEVKARQVALDEQQNRPQAPATPDNRVYIQQNYYQQPQAPISPQAQMNQPGFNQQPNIPPFQQPIPNSFNQQPYQSQINQQQPSYSQISSTQPEPAQISQNPPQNPVNHATHQPTFDPHANTQYIDISNDDQGGDNL